MFQWLFYWNLLQIMTLTLGDYNGKSFSGSLEILVEEFPCVRLFNNEGSIGCRTVGEKTIGALYEIRNQQDINQIKDISVDYAILTSAKYFTSELIEILAYHSPQGVIIYDGDWTPVEDGISYSTDVTTPQGDGTPQSQYSLNSQYEWNNYGNGIMYESLPYPVVRASNNEIKMLQRLCSENRDYGMSGNRVNVGQFRYYMGKDTITSSECLAWKDTYGDRRPQCLPVGGLSVWGSGATMDSREKVIVTAGIDSTAFFHDLAYGANDAVSSIAAILLAVEALGRFQGLANLPKQPVFFLANAEEWGYAGSRRFVRDISSGISCQVKVAASESPSGMPFCTAPIYPSTVFEMIGEAGITDILAIDQVGKLKGGQLFLHSEVANPTNIDVILAANSDVEGVTVTASTTASTIPPTPMSSFLNTFQDLKTTGVVLSGYDANFADPLYHTRFDSGDTIVVDDVVIAAGVIIRSVIALCGGNSALATEIDSSYAAEVVQCLTSDWSCSLMERFVSSEKNNLGKYLGGSVYFDSGSTPPNYYTGVLEASYGGLPVVQHSYYVYGRYEDTWNKHDRVYSIPNYLEAFLRTSLSYHLGSNSREGVCETSSDCGNCTVMEYSSTRMECILDTCVCPTTFYHLALDPGIEPETQANYFEIVDDTAVAYTEPYWNNIGLTVYPRAGTVISVATFSMGVVACFLSILGAIGAHSYMDKIKAL